MYARLKPYATIWIKSRQAFETFFAERPGGPIFGWPFVVYGLSFGIGTAPELYKIFIDNPDLPTRLAFYAVTSVIGLGAAYLGLGLINPWLMRLVGRIWKGPASISQLANVNALSIIPYLLILLYQLALLVFGLEPGLSNIYFLFQWIVGLMCLRLCVIGVSVVQGFSYGIALLKILLTYLPFFIIQVIIRF